MSVAALMMKSSPKAGVHALAILGTFLSGQSSEYARCYTTSLDFVKSVLFRPDLAVRDFLLLGNHTYYFHTDDLIEMIRVLVALHHSRLGTGTQPTAIFASVDSARHR